MEHSVVSREEWLEARRALLTKEKEMTRMRDRVNAARLALPWVRVDKDYVFDTPAGAKTLSELFDGRSQLVIYHFMFGPDWEAGCPGCSFLADHLDGAIVHLNNHDVSFVCVSRAPLDKIEAYKRRMNWHFPWVSSFGSDFNFDYHVSFTREELAAGPVTYNYRETPAEEAHDELPGLSSFYREADGAVFHTYSNYARGGEEMLGTMMILDCAPLGRNEGSTMDFVKRHDEYETRPKAAACCH
ncbi:MAG: thioredoxin family protein [Arenimonas sp.]|nr:thioredoxin family protein [Rhizobium sp.]MBW8445537.1 thioredoxin family protein [Arenimonas sp.]